jgi:phosphate transport system permease protein
LQSKKGGRREAHAAQIMNLYTRRLFVNRFNLLVSLLTMVFGLFWLGWILTTLFEAGFTALKPDLFLLTTPPPGSSGGLLNAIAGSLFMAAAGTLLGTPIGIMAGIYLAEFGGRGWLAPVTRFINDILLSAPSIVIGLFIYEIYVVNVRHFSAWAGIMALALIVIPVVIRTTENMLRLVPDSLREAAAALGAPQWKVITFVTVRAAKAGIITGILLAVARISGETAPLLFTALNNQFWSLNMNAPMANLPVVIFQFAMSPYENWQHLAWAGALLITMSVLALNVFARVFFRNKTPVY